MRIALACLAVAACSHPAPPPGKPPSQQRVRTPVSDVPTCADMGPLLRGHMDDEDTEGARKEALIVAACERDRWPRAVLECAASATEPTVQDCLEQLPPQMLASYDKALAKYGRGGDEDEPPPSDEIIACADVFAATSVDAWPPAVTDANERALASKLRGVRLEEECEDEPWDEAVRTCIAGTPATGVDACIANLGTARQGEVERVIREADELRAKIVKAQAKPANVSCEKVVAAHYGPAKWKGKALELKGAARTKAIDASKKALLQACKQGFTVDARACVVAVDSDACAALGVGTWAYPAITTVTQLAPTGIAECDDYGAALVQLASCASIPQETRTSLLESFAVAAVGWKSLPPEELAAARSACVAAADATRHALAACP